MFNYKFSTMRLCLLTFISILLCSTLQASKWSDYGNFDVSWYNTQDKEFSLYTEAEVAGISYLINEGYTDFSNITINLENDIDLSSHIWIPIGVNTPFKGKFNGNSHKIEGINITRDNNSSNKYYGFFGSIQNATICNLTLYGLIDYFCGTATDENVFIGAFAGTSYNSSLLNNNNHVKIVLSRNNFNAAYSYSTYIGGFIGSSTYSHLYKCENYSEFNIKYGTLWEKVFSNPSSLVIGGIAGTTEDSEIKHCLNRATKLYIETAGGTRTSAITVSIGGITGIIRNTLIKHCSNIIDVISINIARQANICVGGISGIAYIYHDDTNSGVINCYSTTRFIDKGGAENVTLYGGIIGSNHTNASNKLIANFSASNLYTDALESKKGYDGDNNFSSSEMKTDLFLQSLNFYSSTKKENCYWEKTQDYPVIINSEKTSLISIYQNNQFTIENGLIIFDTPTSYNIFNMNGNLIQCGYGLQSKNIKEGVYILSTAKFSTKIILR